MRIGALRDDGTLVKRGKQVVLFRLHDGFGVGLDVLNQVNAVEVHYHGETYTATRADFRKHGIIADYQGYETQFILPRKFWARS